MSRVGPIIIAEGDHDDQEIIRVVLESFSIRNQLIPFDSGEQALHYLKTTAGQPVLIFSDVNLPRMHGFELKRRINQDEHLRRRVPHLFFDRQFGWLDTGNAALIVFKQVAMIHRRRDMINEKLRFLIA